MGDIPRIDTDLDFSGSVKPTLPSFAQDAPSQIAPINTPSDIQGRYDPMNEVVRQAQDPQGERERVNMAYFFAQRFGVDQATAYRNLDSYRELYFGSLRPQYSDWEAIKNEWQLARDNNRIARIAFQMQNTNDPEEWQRLWQTMQELRAQMPSQDDQERSIPVDWLKSFSGLVPQMAESSGIGLIAGGAAALGTLAITKMPSAAMMAFKYVGMLGAGADMARLESGMAFESIVSMTDEQGRHIHPEIARAYSIPVGILNGAIEMVELKAALATFGIGETVFSRAARKAIRRVMTDGTFTATALGFVARSGSMIAENTIQEGVQEINAILAEDLAAELHNELNGTNVPRQNIDDAVDRVLEVMNQSAKGFTVMALTGSVVRGGARAVRAWVTPEQMTPEQQLERDTQREAPRTAADVQATQQRLSEIDQAMKAGEATEADLVEAARLLDELEEAELQEQTRRAERTTQGTPVFELDLEGLQEADRKSAEAFSQRMETEFQVDRETSNVQLAFFKRYAENVGISLSEYIESRDLMNIRPTSEADAARASDRGGMVWSPDQLQAVIYLGKNSDPSTLVHEVTHVEQMRAKNGLDSVFTPEDLQTMQAWAYTQTDSESYREWQSGELTEEEFVSEMITDALEQYLVEGRFPDARVESFLEKLSQLIRDVYQNLVFGDEPSLIGGPNLSPEVRQVYDRILSPQQGGATATQGGVSAAEGGVSAPEGGDFEAQAPEVRGENINLAQREKPSVDGADTTVNDSDPNVINVHHNLATKNDPIIPNAKDPASIEAAYTRAHRLMREDVIKALEAADEDIIRSLTWYSHDIKEMRDGLSREIPELKNDSYWTLFAAITALTSVMNDPRNNLWNAAAIFKYWLRTGQMPTTLFQNRFRLIGITNTARFGQVGAASVNTVANKAAILQKLVEQEGVDGAAQWLTSEVGGKAIEALVGGKVSGVNPTNNKHNGMEMFGPKLGQFGLALLGREDLVVKDRWFSRTWNIYMGTPFKSYNQTWEGVMAKPANSRGDEMAIVPRGPTERALMDRVVTEIAAEMKEKYPQYSITPSAIQALLWYIEKQRFRELGADTPTFSYKDVIDGRVRDLKERGFYSETSGRGFLQEREPDARRRELERILGELSESQKGISDADFVAEPGKANLSREITESLEYKPFLRQKAASPPSWYKGDQRTPIGDLFHMQYVAMNPEQFGIKREVMVDQIKAEYERLGMKFDPRVLEPENAAAIPNVDAVMATVLKRGWIQYRSYSSLGPVLSVWDIDKQRTDVNNILLDLLDAEEIGKNQTITIESLGRTDSGGLTKARVIDFLSRSQYLAQKAPTRTDTKEFRQWFKNSVVTDETGGPKVVYHSGEFDVRLDEVPWTDPDQVEMGMHFGSELAAGERQLARIKEEIISNAEIYQDGGAWRVEIEGYDEGPFETQERAKSARDAIADDLASNMDVAEETITAAYLSMQNPLRLPDLGNFSDIERLTRALQRLGISVNVDDRNAIRDAIEEAGYDGVVYENRFEDVGSESYIIFHPEQAKSAEYNDGTFDPNNPSMLRQRELPGQVSFEARPGLTTGDTYKWMEALSYEQQEAFLSRIMDILHPGRFRGEDAIADKIGLRNVGYRVVPGYWEGQVNPSVQLMFRGRMLPDPNDEGFYRGITPELRDKITAYTSIIGTLLKQDGMGWHLPSNGADTMAALVDTRRQLTPDETKSLSIELEGRVGGFALVGSQEGARILNFSGLNQEEFRKAVIEAVEASTINEEGVEVTGFDADGDLIENNWEENPNGEGYRQRASEAGSSDLFEWAIREFGPDIEQAYRDFGAGRGQKHLAQTGASWFKDGNLRDVDRTHIRDVLDNPEEYGFNKQELVDIFLENGEKIGQEGKAREQIIRGLVDKGWLRVRHYAYPDDHWSVTVKNIKRQRGDVEDLIFKLIDDGSVTMNSQLKILSTDDGSVNAYGFMEGGVKAFLEGKDGSYFAQRARSVHKGAVRQAIESGRYVPDAILDQYSNESWATEEIDTRERLKEAASGYESLGRFVSEYLATDSENKTPEYYARIFRSAQEEGFTVRGVNNAQFMSEMTADKLKSILLSIHDNHGVGVLRSKKLQQVAKRIAAGKVTDKQIAAAQEIIGKDPGYYRSEFSTLLEDDGELSAVYAEMLADTESYELSRMEVEVAQQDKELQAAKDELRKSRGKSRKKVSVNEALKRERARVREKKTRQRMIRSIMRVPGASVAWEYRKRIEQIQGSLIVKKSERRKQLEATMRAYADEAGVTGDQLRAELNKQSLSEMPLADLKKIQDEVAGLKREGRDKRSLELLEERAQIHSWVEEIISALTGEDRSKIHGWGSRETKEMVRASLANKIRKGTFRPDRLMEYIDGRFDGPTKRIFYDQINEARNQELREYNKRADAAADRMKELNLNPYKLGHLRFEINGMRYSVDDVISMYVGMQNSDSAAALIYGNRIGSQEDIQQAIDGLTPQEKAWGDYMMDSFSREDFERMLEVMLKADNTVAPWVDKYFPMIREGLETANAEIIVDMEQRTPYHRGKVNDRFLKKRVQINPENQIPIKLGATQIFFRQLANQEKYISHRVLIKRLNRIIANKDFQSAIRKRFGTEYVQWFQKYVNDVANPNLYRSAQEGLGQLSRSIRTRMQLAYLGFNLITMAKQLPSAVFYLADAGPVHLLGSAMRFFVDGKNMRDRMWEASPQQRNRSINRAQEELKLLRAEGKHRVISEMGRISMWGIKAIDTMAVTIGWNAVYEKSIQANMSEQEAIDAADRATARTQPTSDAKDLPDIYRSGEGYNWLLMFSNQLNQIWNMMVADIPAYAREKMFGHVIATTVGIGISAMAIGFMSYRDIPDEEEDETWGGLAWQYLMNQVISAIPLIGGNIKSGLDGWWGMGIDPLPLASQVGSLARVLSDADADEVERFHAFMETVMDGMVATGLPTVFLKRLHNTFYEDTWFQDPQFDPLEILGGFDE